MKHKGLLVLWVGYLTWVLVATKFLKKDKNKKFESKMDEFQSDVIQVHKDLFKFLDKNFLTEDNKKLVNEYKEKIYKEVEDFKVDSEKYLEELKEKWIGKKDEIEAELKKIYEKRIDDIEKIKKQAWNIYGDIKNIILEVIDESREKIEETYNDTKKKIVK